ncbi:MAG: flagellar basal-body rod protein FlgF [Gallionellales bacterium RIFOXYD2_FULL_52_7]|nr:MAG: flagellar basal-body rod protein FlgF [Gallionellales bacterium RIFOXYD2_FULL_52_7]
MDKLIYTAMTGASHVLQQQAAVSENLANTNTPGFRATLNTFRAVPLVGEGLPTRTFVVDSTAGFDFTPAAFQPTGRSLDVAVNGTGWLAVQGPDGKEAYTRNGSFQISSSGVLQTRNGLNVLSDSGPITIPPGTQLTFAKDGTISTVPEGNQATSVVVVVRLKLVNPDVAKLERGGDGMFRMKDGSTAPADAKTEIAPGNLEGSNVSTVEMMVNMISLARKFDMQMKMLQTADNDAKQASSIMSIAG